MNVDVVDGSGADIVLGLNIRGGNREWPLRLKERMLENIGQSRSRSSCTLGTRDGRRSLYPFNQPEPTLYHRQLLPEWSVRGPHIAADQCVHAGIARSLQNTSLCNLG